MCVLCQVFVVGMCVVVGYGVGVERFCVKMSMGVFVSKCLLKVRVT